MLTELEEVLPLYSAPDPTVEYPGSPIVVDEEAQTVTAAAGVSQRILLDYLAAYR